MGGILHSDHDNTVLGWAGVGDCRWAGESQEVMVSERISGRSLGQTQRAELGFWSPICALQPHPLCSLKHSLLLPHPSAVLNQPELLHFSTLLFCASVCLEQLSSSCWREVIPEEQSQDACSQLLATARSYLPPLITLLQGEMVSPFTAFYAP